MEQTQPCAEKGDGGGKAVGGVEVGATEGM
jgi:hypothetical protein